MAIRRVSENGQYSGIHALQTAAPWKRDQVFLGASQEKIAEGFKIILSDKKVKAILINIFGGIMNCQTLASGILEAAHELQPSIPIVIRMEGTNVEQGKKILKESGLKFFVAEGLADAAKQAVALAKGAYVNSRQ